MAQYYRARGEISLFQRDSTSAHDDEALGSPLVDDLELGDIYIFPHPSSVPPSPSQFSDLSAPTDFSYSNVSEPRSRDASPGSYISRDPSLSSLPVDVDSDVWSWSASRGFGDGRLGHEARREQWELVLRRRPSPRNLQHSASQPRSTRYSPSPHPRIHIPLLSYFLTLFSIDDETLHLLCHTSHQSTLFPGAIVDAATPGDDTENRLHHRVTKLLHAAHTDSASHSLKEGLAVAYDSPPSHALPFTGLFSLVSSLVSNGGKALREVLSY